MFQTRLKSIRKKRGYTQQTAADNLNLSLRSYQRYEAQNGYCDPPLNTLINIADLFDVSIDYLLGRDEWLAAHGVSFDEY